MTPIVTALIGLFVLGGAPQAGWAANNNAAVTASLPSYQVGLTGYNAVPGQTDDDPFTTASGAYSNPQVVAARSVDLADELPFGTVIEITGSNGTMPNCGYDQIGEQIGLRVIADSMNPRIHNRVDILFGNNDIVKVGNIQRNAAGALGMCKGTTVQVVGHIDINHIPKTQAELQNMMNTGAFASAN
ncbi:MAG TPA: hypothetical protein VN495_01045 [Candidatus Paceibacterota bacterium]|nr:hypothetical protein [Candidatus Paceibacterota bacterium]